MTRIQQWSQRALVITFLAGLAAPGLVAGVQKLRPSPDEPAAAALPRIKNVRTFFEATAAARDRFTEHFGLRQTLIEWNGWLNYHLFGVSASSQVLVGSDGWLFYAASKGIEDYRCVEPYTPAELDAWENMLVERHRFLQARGIRFVFMVAPNKQTIYPEYLPRWVTRVNPQSRLDQLAERLRMKGEVTFLDVRPQLLEAKAKMPVYFRTDTHWTPLGSQIAFQQLAKQLHAWFPDYPLPVFEDSNRVRAPVPSGDLARFAGVPGLFEEITGYNPPLQRSHAVTAVDPAEAARQGRDVHFIEAVITERPGAAIRSAVFIRDSFSMGMEPWISDAFGRVALQWTTAFDVDLIEREKPDVVVFELVERGLMQAAPPAFTHPVAGK